MVSIIFDNFIETYKMKTTLCILIFYITTVNYNYAQIVPLKEVASKHFKNLYKVNNSLYRSEQPSKNGFKALELIGVKTILNLRRLKDDNKKAKHFNFKLIHQPIKTKALNENDILEALRVIQNSEPPVLVHCWHGSDRTGTIIAAYRMVVENWTKAQAIDEFQRDELGYHHNMYPQLLELLKGLDIQSVKDKLN